MKKIFGLILIMSLGIISQVLGEQIRSPMNDVGLYFCDKGTEKEQLEINSHILINPGEKKSICLYFYNSSDKKMTFVYGFANGKYGEYGELLCDGDDYTENKTNEFGRFFPKTSKRQLVIPANSFEIIKQEIEIPVGIKGSKVGCIAYKLGESEVKEAGGMFNMVFRKSSEINLFIGGDGSVKNSIKLNKIQSPITPSNPKIKAEIDDLNNLTLGFSIENDGNMNQNINIDGRIYNSLGFEKKFEIKDRIIIPGKTEELSTNIGIIPSYKGFFNIEFTVKNEIKSDFNLSELGEDAKKITEIKETAKIFIFTRMWLVIGILGIVVLWMMFRPLFKKRNPQPSNTTKTETAI